MTKEEAIEWARGPSLREAAQQALEALEESLYATTDKSQFLAFEAITTLRAALAEPVQEQCKGDPGECEFNGGCMYACAKPEPLCAAPPQRKPLSDADLAKIWDDAGGEP